jgi:aminoglycoside 6'-N-acetyltransferase I
MSTGKGANSLLVETAAEAHRAAWLRLRDMLWPQPRAEQSREITEILNEPERYAAFLCRAPTGDYAGFAEAAIRNDYVNGCETSPVAFLEGIFVEPAQRRQGMARALCGAVEQWARDHGCREFASDADLSNLVSHRMHGALGFAETGRIVYFRKLLS